MDEYLYDIFYDIEKLPYEKIMELVKEAMDMSETMFVDRIEGGGQRRNVPGADPYEWIETYPKEKTLFRFIHRRGYNDMYHLQIVVNEFINFLWINLKEDQIPYFVEKYKLEEL